MINKFEINRRSLGILVLNFHAMGKNFCKYRHENGIYQIVGLNRKMLKFALLYKPIGPLIAYCNDNVLCHKSFC